MLFALIWTAAALACGVAAGSSIPAAADVGEQPQTPVVAVPAGGAGRDQAAPPAQPATVSAEAAAADEMESLQLTELQRRILEQVFNRCVFETPAPPAPDAVFGVKVEPTVPGGLYRMGTGGDLPPVLVVTARSVARRSSIHLTYFVQDFYGRKVAAGLLPPVFPDEFGVATADLVLDGVQAFGYYHVLVTATTDEHTAMGWCGIAVVHPFTRGEDPRSPFGLLAPPGRIAEHVPEVASRLGARHLALDWSDGAMVAEMVAKAGLSAAAIVRLDSVAAAAEPEPFAAATAETVQRLSESVTAWHLGRMPVLVPDPPAEMVESYRRRLAATVAALRATGAKVSVWASATPDILADVLTEGPVLAGVDGVALQVDAGAGAPNLRSGAFRRSLDFGIQVARRMKITRTVLAGTGDDPAVGSPQQQAWKLVTRHVLALAGGAERVFTTWGRGAPRPLASAAAYAWMAHLLEGAVYQGSAWPDLPLLEAHLFAGPERRVAVVWSWLGDDPAACDRGVLVFENGTGLSAVDVVGQRVGIWKNRRLIVPLGEAPIYITSTELSVGQLRDRLRAARIVGLPPASIHIESLVRGEAAGRFDVTLLVQSHRPHRLTGMAALLPPQGWSVRKGKEHVSLEPGQARRVTIECDAPALASAGPHTFEAVVSLNEEYARCTQPVWVTQAPERLVEVGYGLTGWEGIEPVVVSNDSGTVKAEVRTAWDAKFFYFLAVVHRSRAGFKPDRYGRPGDDVQLAWGLQDRADDDFGHRGRDASLPAGAFRDTDHLMAITFGKDGAQVLRLRGPRTAFRQHVPGNDDPWYGPEEGAFADISRDQSTGQTLYAAAIPMKALAPLRARRGEVFRFGFRIGDAGGTPLEWARAAKVPDWLANPASFLPASCADGLPCQTWWALVGPTKR